MVSFIRSQPLLTRLLITFCGWHSSHEARGRAAVLRWSPRTLRSCVSCKLNWPLFSGTLFLLERTRDRQMGLVRPEYVTYVFSKVKWKWKSLSPVQLFVTPWNSPGQNTGVSSLSLLQGIFPTQGSYPGLPHCRRILYQLNHQRSPFSKRNEGGLSAQGTAVAHLVPRIKFKLVSKSLNFGKLPVWAWQLPALTTSDDTNKRGFLIWTTEELHDCTRTHSEMLQTFVGRRDVQSAGHTTGFDVTETSSVWFQIPCCS